MKTTLRGTAVRLCAVFLASAIMVGGVSLIDSQFAFAQQCEGRTERVNLDYNDVTHAVKIDSCKAQQLVDAYGNVKDEAGLMGLLGARWWPIGAASGVLFGWAWNNQAKVKGAATAGRGVEFIESHGVVVTARPQG
jgi:hypothetical protein